MCTASALRMKPPPQQKAATSAALRGPAFSSQPPKSAAEMPRMTMAVSNAFTVTVSGQLQVVEVISWKKPAVLHAASSVGMTLASGFQKTLSA